MGFVTLEKNKQQIVSLALLAGWAAMLLLSILFTPLSILLKGTTIISILTRAGILYSLWVLFQYLFGSRELSSDGYEHILMYIGYAIVFTYVFTMLPQVVAEYYKLKLWGGSPFYVIWVILTTAFPSALWVWLNLDKNRIAMGAYSKKALKKYKEIQKDKKKKKAEQKRKHSQRGPLGNLWAEWIEPLFGAVLWVLVINHFVLQLYQIPSESMVPTFLVRDRVLVGKSFYAPNIPLTDYKLPRMVKPKEGEVIIFTNPKVEDPQSDLYYKNVFARVFHTFVYMITFTTVDIDAKPDGTPKARLLVKRNIAGEGEKICLLNDQVYKKREGEDWVLMSDIPGQKEYGIVEQYSKDNSRLEAQRETPGTRALVEEAQSLVEGYSESQLSELLAEEKKLFLEALSRLDRQDLLEFEEEVNRQVPLLTDLHNASILGSLSMMYYNKPEILLSRYQNISMEQWRRAVMNFDSNLAEYDKYLLNMEARNLLIYLAEEDKNAGYLDDQISTELIRESDDSPYEAFMAKFNALYKIKKMQFYTALIEDQLLLNDQLFQQENSQELYRLLFYIQGYGAMNTFDMANLPEFPQQEGEYIAEEEYFLMGDNRYNSLDSRMGERAYMTFVDARDQSDFAMQAEVSWEPHSIPLRLIHGKVRLILFPFDRLHFFK